MTAHRYWRVTSYSDFGNIGTAIYANEIDFYDETDTIISTVGGTAIASNESLGAASNAFDNNTGTNWAAGVFTESWIGMDFGSGNDTEVDRVDIRSSGSDLGQMMYFGWVQYSDDNVTWVNSFPYVNTTAWTANETRTFNRPAASTSATRWRIFFARSLAGNEFNAYNQLEMLESGVDVTSGETFTASDEFSGATLIANAFDDNDSTIWSGEATYPCWAEVEFATAKEITAITVTAQDTTVFNEYASGFLLAYHDGSDWVPVYAWRGKAPARNQTDTYTVGSTGLPSGIPTSIIELVTKDDFIYDGTDITGIVPTISGGSTYTVNGTPARGSKRGLEMANANSGDYVSLSSALISGGGNHIMTVWKRNATDVSNVSYYGTSNVNDYAGIANEGNGSTHSQNFTHSSIWYDGSEKVSTTTRDTLNTALNDNTETFVLGLESVTESNTLYLGRYTNTGFGFEGEFLGAAIFTDWSQAGEIEDFLIDFADDVVSVVTSTVAHPASTIGGLGKIGLV